MTGWAFSGGSTADLPPLGFADDAEPVVAREGSGEAETAGVVVSFLLLVTGVDEVAGGAPDCAHVGSTRRKTTAMANPKGFIGLESLARRRKIEMTIYSDKDAMGRAGVNSMP